MPAVPSISALMKIFMPLLFANARHSSHSVGRALRSKPSFCAEVNMGKTELWQWDAVDLAKAIRLRKISSYEATKACLDRLDAVNPKLNAITFQIAEQALRDAEAADAAVKAGAALGPLHGVPVSTKENIDQKDLPTT